MTAPARYVAQGSMAAYDDLTQAVDGFSGDFTALRAAAIKCGLPDGADLVVWARDRVRSYRRLTGQADAWRVCAAYAKALDGPDFPILSKVA